MITRSPISPGAEFSREIASHRNQFLLEHGARKKNELMELVNTDCWRPAFIDVEPSGSLRRPDVVLRLFRPFRLLIGVIARQTMLS
jgi:hypothetical protein